MAHRHAQRKARRGARPVLPGDGCLRRWRRLIKRAGGPGFVEAAEDAARATMPPGHQHRGSAFDRLIAVGRGFAHIGPAERPAVAEQARRLAEECARALEAHLDSMTERADRPQRKDIA